MRALTLTALLWLLLLSSAELLVGQTSTVLFKEQADGEICVTVFDPVTAEQIETVWRAPEAITAVEIYCETDAGTVGFDWNIDDGTPAGINGSDISCASTGTTDATFAGDTTLAVGDRLDIDIGTVATATQVSFCLKFRKD